MLNPSSGWGSVLRAKKDRNAVSSLRDVGMFLELYQESVAERIKQDGSETRELALIVYLWTSCRKLGVLFMLFLYVLTEISGVGPSQGQASGS